MIVRRDGERIVAHYESGKGQELSFWTWPEWQKVAKTRATRMTGPFTVETSEGPLTCEDGYVAVDARGYPYPIAADEFELIYRPADEAEGGPRDDLTVVERIAELEAEIRAKQAEGWGDPRELALALTHLEDCQMRFTRARAKATGVFKPVDLERVEARAERERFEQQAGEAAS